MFDFIILLTIAGYCNRNGANNTVCFGIV